MHLFRLRAKGEGEEYRLDYGQHPNKLFAGKFVAFAREHPASEGALKALSQLLRIGKTDADKKWALETILKDHLGSKGLTGAIFGIRYAHWADRETVLRTIADKSPHAEVKGRALLSLGQVLKSDPKKALRIFSEVEEKYKDVKGLGGQAASEIYEIQFLAVGKPAPEIEGEDIDGVNFKLSDYRGKVVMIDFWGDW